jgi:hypothetical protein
MMQIYLKQSTIPKQTSLALLYVNLIAAVPQPGTNYGNFNFVDEISTTGFGFNMYNK